jgi:tetratricopeptide (TPR) repeat protein
MRRLATASILVFESATLATAVQHDHHATSQRLLSVHFPISCKPKVAGMFDRGVTLLHAFWFKAAIDTFKLVAHSDVDCAMAWWGIALAQWGDPFDPTRPPGALEAGRQALANAGAARSASARERQYIAGVAELFRDDVAAGQTVKLRAYERAMGRLSEEFPNDSEAAVFAALAAVPQAKSVAERQAAGARLERLSRQQPDHPGLAHYVIHVYDAPSLANKGLEAARHYATIAPAAPHALHVPSHIFMRLGLWDEALEANLVSADAARRDGASADELHALDYQVYALLQTGQDRQAAAVVQRLTGLRTHVDAGTRSTATPATAYFALAAMPARLALERGDWAGAASLDIDPTPIPWVAAVTHFARGIGAARSDQVASARHDLEQLVAIRDRVSAGKDVEWTQQIDLQCRTVQAWILFAEARPEAALRLLAAAADDEDEAELPGISPGPLGPARELLGEMLLETNRPADALAAFERVLAREPNRLRALHGAARAARKAGDAEKSAGYYDVIVGTCRRADDPPRPMIAEARARQRVAGTGQK